MQDISLRRIAELALSTFDALPVKCKPRDYPDGRREWTPMSAVVLRRCIEGHDDEIKCIALATGTKCLPASSLSRCDGAVLHDCHAEILALRCFNYWVLSEIEIMLQNHVNSEFLEKLDQKADEHDSVSEATIRLPFRFRHGISVYLFSTEAPCGDASMELLMSSKSSEENQPWSADALAADLASGVPLGRGHFSLLGALRRKPSRGDAEPSMSRSCTDKLMLKQFTSLLAFPADLFVQPTSETFLKGLILYENQFHESGYQRAFGKEGRLAAADDQNGIFFDFHTLLADFPGFDYQKSSRAQDARISKPTNISSIWISGVQNTPAMVEVLVNGVKQGYRQFEPRRGKQSAVCRRNLTEKATRIYNLLAQDDERPHSITAPHLTYCHAKAHQSRKWKVAKKQHIVQKLGSWPSVSSYDDFTVSLEDKTSNLE